MYPAHELSRYSLMAPARNEHLRGGSKVVREGQVAGPDDLVYDAMYGWIKRVTVNESVADSVVHNWVNAGGRPLGLAFGQNGEVLVAEAHKGLLTVTREGKIEVLTDEAEGLKFEVTNGVDVGDDGTFYFTDASYKYFTDVGDDPNLSYITKWD